MNFSWSNRLKCHKDCFETNDEGAVETTASLIDHITTKRSNCIIEAGTLETSFTDYYLVHI